MLSDKTKRVITKQKPSNGVDYPFSIRSWSWNICKFMSVFDGLSKTWSEKWELQVTLVTEQEGKLAYCGIESFCLGVQDSWWPSSPDAFFDRGGNWGSEMLDELCQVTQVIKDTSPGAFPLHPSILSIVYFWRLFLFTCLIMFKFFYFHFCYF